MNPVAIWISITLHIIILILSYLGLGDTLGKHSIKDTGHVVFDFVTIGNKSRAPVLSNENSRVGRTKSHTEEKKTSENLKQKSSNETKNMSPVNESSKKPPKKNNDTKENKVKKKDEEVQADKIVSPKTNKKIKTPATLKNKNNNQKKSNNAHKTAKKNNMTKKTGDKALVNLNNNKKSSKLNSGTKGVFDSVIDSVLADGNYENSGVNAEEVGGTLTATQIDLVRETIRPCWHFPAGLKNAEQLIVDIKMEIDNKGYVKNAIVEDKHRVATDPNFRTAAESAVRAVLDPACNPLPLPADKYAEWKDLELSFNPKDWN